MLVSGVRTNDGGTWPSRRICFPDEVDPSPHQAQQSSPVHDTAAEQHAKTPPRRRPRISGAFPARPEGLEPPTF